MAEEAFAASNPSTDYDGEPEVIPCWRDYMRWKNVVSINLW